MAFITKKTTYTRPVDPSRPARDYDVVQSGPFKGKAKKQVDRTRDLMIAATKGKSEKFKHFRAPKRAEEFYKRKSEEAGVASGLGAYSSGGIASGMRRFNRGGKV